MAFLCNIFDRPCCASCTANIEVDCSVHVMDLIYLRTTLFFDTQDLMNADSVESVQQTHDSMMERVLRICLLERYKVWRVVRKSVLGLLDQVLNACILIRNAANCSDGLLDCEMLRKLERVAKDFRETHSFLLRLLTSYSMALGGSIDLEHLIMRFNFNEYYSASLTPLQEFEKMLQDFTVQTQ